MKKSYYEHYCDNIENIENYEKALEDNFKGWHCHHRLETHNSDGERRLVDISKKELKALGMYYDRPSEELIFLTASEHIRLHQEGKHFSDEHKKKLLEAHKGKKLSEETKSKIAAANKGKHHSKKVLCLETGIVFESMTDVQRKTGISSGNILQVCQGKRKTVGGVHWAFV